MGGVVPLLGALGTLGALAGPGSVGRLITIGGSLLLGIAFAWLGYELIAETGDLGGAGLRTDRPTV